MNIVRNAFDTFYDFVKPVVFKLTEKDPQRAHEFFTFFCRALHSCGLERVVLDNASNMFSPPFELSNAAGFNKNGDLPPRVLYYFGCDRVVVGTVTRDAWPGRPRPNIRRYASTASMVNWMGLPGRGARAVADTLNEYGNHKVQITINVMATPNKEGDELLRDLEGTVLATRGLSCVDRFELNISCPNTHVQGGGDARERNVRMLDAMLAVVNSHALDHQDIHVKVSPDSTSEDVRDTLSVLKNYSRVRGVTTTNTTTQHDRRYIPESPQVNGQQVGGASGNAVYEESLRVQRLYQQQRTTLGRNLSITACGGINSRERAEERFKLGATGVQVYTPIVFSGTRLLRELRGTLAILEYRRSVYRPPR